MHVPEQTADVAQGDVSDVPHRWLGAVSFEDRCSASLTQLRARSTQLERVVFVDYGDPALFDDEDQDRRSHNAELMASLVPGQAEVHTAEIDPYSFYDFVELVGAELEAAPNVPTIFDISCLTKIHTLALATALAHREGIWTAAYTIPQNYRLPGAQETPGWRDIVVAPLTEYARLFNEHASRGVIIPGHEADRLIIALSELEPSGGLVAIAEAEARPDLRAECERRNYQTIRRLLELKSSVWTRHVVGVRDLDRLRVLLEAEIVRVREAAAPIVLFPYGPKPLILQAALILARSYADSAWFVYPIPVSYDIQYTEGVAHTAWLGHKRFAQTA